jgi:Fe-S cluster biosynthesis and repair protein YggX
MPVTCTRCGQTAEGPPPHRISFTGPAREQILKAICGACWKEWEAMEVRVVNEYRLSFLDPQHREALLKACLEFLGLPAPA